MRWLEIITVRSAGGIQLFADFNFVRLVKETPQDEGARRPEFFMVYSHGINKTDVSFHLHYRTKAIDIRQSLLGWRLIETLKPYGLVSHGIWIEQKTI